MDSCRFALIALIGSWFVQTCHAGDWPEFRGPTAQGHYEGKTLPIEWGPNQNVAWRTPIPGLGWSSPAIVGGRIYLTTAVEKGADHSLRALCLDARSGKIVWNQEVFEQDGGSATRVHAKNSHASPSPIVRDGKVYVHFGHQGTACLDLGGKILWTNRELRYSPVHGNGGSPLLVGDKLIFSCDGASDPFVVGLDAGNGKVAWKTPRSWDCSKTFAFSTPLLIKVQDREQVVLPGAGGVAAYEPATGKEIWKVLYGEGYSVVPRPVFGHGLVFLSSGYDTPNLLAIRVDGSGDVTDTHIAWRSKRAAPHNPSPLLVGDELYLASDRGQASCLDAKTGKVHWQETIPGAYSASPLFANGHIYYLSESGLATVVKASKQFEVVEKNAMSERSLASFAAAEGALYLRTEKALYRIERR